MSLGVCGCGKPMGRYSMRCRDCWRDEHKANPPEGWGGYHPPRLEAMSDHAFGAYVRVVKAELERRRELRGVQTG